MKTLCFIFILLAAAGVPVHSQTIINEDNYQLVLSVSGRKIDLRGYLMNTTDSTITISTRKSILLSDQRTFKAEEIEYIMPKHMKTKKSGIIFGATVGLATAIVLGQTQKGSKDDFFYFTPAQSTLLASIITVPSGVVLGAFLLGNKRTIRIKNSQKTYAEQRNIIEQYKYRD